MSHEDYYDASRYDSAADWEPKPLRSTPEQRRRERERAKLDDGFSPFDLAAGAAASRPQTLKRPARLFGPLWTQGELAILFGPASSGKSILAVQLADQISRRTNPGSPNPFAAAAKPQKVLYIDFERTPAQFAERYSAPHPLPGKLPVRHRFPNNFTRLWLEGIHDVPARFRGDTHRYLAYWIEDAIETACAPIVIIDNLSYLNRSLTHPTSAGRLMKTLKLWLTRYQISILATAHSRERGRPRPLVLADLAAAQPVTDLADTVFAIAPSRLAPDLRYIKHLKSRTGAIENDEHNVITCQLTREAEQRISPNSSFEIQNSPFLSLNFLGLTPESIHLTDPMALLSPPQPAVRPLQLKKDVVNMLLSPEYKPNLER